MDNAKLHLPPLAEYLDLRDAQKQLGVFPSLESFRWFVRNNRDRLVECGAMILVAGRQKFHLDLTRRVVVQCGHLAAVGKGEK
jgi:hypothetical protein